MAVATNEQQVIESIPTKLYIAGEWVDGSEGETIAVEDPATEETLVEVSSGNKDDAFKALDADLPSLVVLPIDYSIDVAISEELGTETVAT